MLNKVQLIANCAEPEVKYLDNGKLCNLSVAVTERYKDRNGDQKENTEWIPVVVFGKTVDFIENFVKKGSLLYIEGKLRTREFTDKSGSKKKVTEVVAETVKLLSKIEKQERKPYVEKVEKPVEDLPIDDSGLPF